MNKLTIFTVILSILVVVVISEVLFNNYLSNVEEGQVSILTTQSPHPSLNTSDDLPTSPTTNKDVDDSLGIIEKLSFEDINEQDDSNDFDINSLADNDQDISIDILELSNPLSDSALGRSGFPLGSELVNASFDGFVYQTIDVTDLNLEVKKQYVASPDEVYGAIYSFSVDENGTNELYRVLRERAAFGESVEVNETNTFGDNSFYMNDSRRESTAFLVVRSGNKFYALAYPKKFHEYFKPLAQNL